MIPYSLRLYPSFLSSDTAMVLALENVTQDWRRSIRVQGGYWQGSFTVEGDSSFLQNFFYRYLGNHVAEKVGQLATWEGLVYEMELDLEGVRRRRSLDLLSNRVKCDYTDTAAAAQSTAWATDANSIARYGQRDEVVSLAGGQYPLATAQARRSTQLLDRGWPWAHPVAITEPGSPKLTVSVCGYIFTANWRYVTSADAATGNVDAWLSSIVSTDCEFLSSVSLDTNALQVKRTLANPKQGWDLIKELTALGDGTNLWRFWVGPGRVCRYAAIDVAPRYFLRRGGVYTKVGSRETVNPWLIQPGVFRDAMYPVRRAEPGSPWLKSAADIWVPEVEVGVNSGLQLKADVFDVSELLSASQEYQA